MPNHIFVVKGKSLQNAKCAGETRDSSGAPRGQEEVNISALNFCQNKTQPRHRGSPAACRLPRALTTFAFHKDKDKQVNNACVKMQQRRDKSLPVIQTH